MPQTESSEIVRTHEQAHRENEWRWAAKTFPGEQAHEERALLRRVRRNRRLAIEYARTGRLDSKEYRESTRLRVIAEHELLDDFKVELIPIKDEWLVVLVAGDDE
jgi:hypothetical protein